MDKKAVLILKDKGPGARVQMEVKFLKNYNSSNNQYQKLILCMPSTLLSITTSCGLYNFFLIIVL